MLSPSIADFRAAVENNRYPHHRRRFDQIVIHSDNLKQEALAKQKEQNTVTASAHLIQQWYERALHTYWLNEYRAYLNNEDTLAEFLEDYPPAKLADLPAPVAQAQAYYDERVQQQDWGTVRSYRVAIEETLTYAIYVTTDGDDGWLEIYAADGTLLGAARTYIEVIGWADVGFIRAQTEAKGFPPAMDRTATLWGKPLP